MGTSCIGISPQGGPAELLPLVPSSTELVFKEKQSLLAHEHHSHVPLPRERMGNPTFLLDVTCVQGMAERCSVSGISMFQETLLRGGCPRSAGK